MSLTRKCPAVRFAVPSVGPTSYANNAWKRRDVFAGDLYRPTYEFSIINGLKFQPDLTRLPSKRQLRWLRTRKPLVYRESTFRPMNIFFMCTLLVSGADGERPLCDARWCDTFNVVEKQAR